jgi:dihydrofolate reductase
MRKLVLFMHTSLDGFTARPDGAMDWINVSDEMFEYARIRTEASDTALYGRHTYEMMNAYWPTAAEQPGATKHDIEHSEWYNRVDKVVVSTTMGISNVAGTTTISDNVPEAIARLKHQRGEDIIMFGSPSLAQAMIQNNLIDEYWLFVNPVILGEGISLFDMVKNEVKLKLVNADSFSAGVVCLHYTREQ